MKKVRIVIYIWVLVFLEGGQASAQNQYITFSFPQWVPMEYLDEAGAARGLLVEISRLVFEEELGLVLRYNERPWKRAQLEVEKGVSDFTFTVPTLSRKAYALVSKSVFYTLPLYIYTYKNHEKLEDIHKIRSAQDIKQLNLIPVTNLGNGWHKDNVDVHGIATHYVRKEENMLLFVANKRADIMIDGVVPTNYLIKKHRLNQKIVLTNSRFSQAYFHLLLSRKSKFAGWMDRIDAAFEKFRKSGRIQAIVSKYEQLESQ